MPKTIGLALGGGFVLGAAHVGVLKVLEENGIKPHMIAGTSAGSIVGSLYAYGWTVDQLDIMIRKLKPGMFIDEFAAIENFFVMTIKLIFDVLHLPYPFRSPLGLMRGVKLEQFIKSKLGQYQFENAPRQLAITSVDITNGKKVIFLSRQDRLRLKAKGDQVFVSGVPVWQAVRASTAVPGLYEPKEINGYLLVDGGLRENVPAQVLKALGATTVIAVDLGNDGEEPKVPRNIAQMMSQTLDIIRSEAIEYVLDDNADVRIRPLLKGVGSWEFHKIPYIIEQGEKAARELLPDILRVCGRR
ncbi:patatin-like phospholipase family protein [Desulforamulus putei]|uniref:NTE family protein n=1 Tax=Desulforamulus putei DSM 12395 TaxID=1121429 RepID=A0A1M5BHD1_9FIRM|nr:patatin-like phospholipase family protein [Desulforamulus putei]SHF42023.1 NTE family protein [Desulforamulus putei DSM 12395]